MKNKVFLMSKNQDDLVSIKDVVNFFIRETTAPLPDGSYGLAFEIGARCVSGDSFIITTIQTTTKEEAWSEFLTEYYPQNSVLLPLE